MGNIARMREMNGYKILIGKPEGKLIFGRFGRM
jgi:hypothetical protein